MTAQEVKTALENHPASSVKIGFTDIDGVLRGKILSKMKLIENLEEELGFCNVVFGWDIDDQCYDNTQVSGWHTGYPDAFIRIDPITYREIPWESDTPFLIADFSSSGDKAGSVCPRTLLKKVLEKYEASGYSVKVGAEYEWFNFREEPASFYHKTNIDYNPISPGMFGYSLLRLSQSHSFVSDIFSYMESLGIPLESLHTETGPGVLEASIKYTTALESADRAALFKHGIKAIAAKHGLMATFMAKWNQNLPGCGGHMHQSIWSTESDHNLFHDPENPQELSALGKQFLAGLLHCLPYILPLFAPTVNSYKRFVEGSWASTHINWGIDNRTTAIRVITGKDSGARIENRVPGADANPYLAIAASLAAGLYGIRNKLSLPPPSKGNAYAIPNQTALAKSLPEAIRTMKESSLPGELFGETFSDHFIRTREWESREFEKVVTDWELKRYFENI